MKRRYWRVELVNGEKRYDYNVGYRIVVQDNGSLVVTTVRPMTINHEKIVEVVAIYAHGHWISAELNKE